MHLPVFFLSIGSVEHTLVFTVLPRYVDNDDVINVRVRAWLSYKVHLEKLFLNNVHLHCMMPMRITCINMSIRRSDKTLL